jgi:hypothetical protein
MHPYCPVFSRITDAANSRSSRYTCPPWTYPLRHTIASFNTAPRYFTWCPLSWFACLPVSMYVEFTRRSSTTPRVSRFPCLQFYLFPCVYFTSLFTKPSSLELPTSNRPVPRFPGSPASMYPCLPPRPCGPRETDPYSNAPIPTGRPVSLSPGIRVSLSPGTRLPQRWLDIYDPVRDSTPGPLFPCFPAPLPPRIQFPFHSHETVHGHTCSLVSMSTVLYLSNGKNPRIYPCFLLPLTGLWRAAELVQIVRTAGHSPTCFPVAPYTCSHVPKETKATNRPHNLVTRLPVALSLRVTVSRFPCSRAVPGYRCTGKRGPRKPANRATI